MVMEGTSEDANQLVHKCIGYLHEEVNAGIYKNIIAAGSPNMTSGWTLPLEDYIRFDVDAAQDQNGVAACGGLYRDRSGRWICGFQKRLGFSIGSTMAEIMAIQHSLQVCKARGLKRIKMHSDSAEALHLLLRGQNQYHPLAEEIQSIRMLIYSDWDLEITYTCRENLCCVNALAKHALSSNNELIILDSPPAFCSDQMLA